MEEIIFQKYPENHFYHYLTMFFMHYDKVTPLHCLENAKEHYAEEGAENAKQIILQIREIEKENDWKLFRKLINDTLDINISSIDPLKQIANSFITYIENEK